MVESTTPPDSDDSINPNTDSTGEIGSPKRRRWPWLMLAALPFLAGYFAISQANPKTDATPVATFEAIDADPNDAAIKAGGEIENALLTIEDVLVEANATILRMSSSLDDYTATFVKQERGDDGVLSPEGRIAIKSQTRLRNATDDAPRRIYLKFEAPPAVAGREVIWAEGENDGKMAVHEVGFLLGMRTLWLDPTGMLAMQGQKYPISEIGLVKLAEKLIDRGEKLKGESDVKITRVDDHDFDGHPTTLFRIERSTPSGAEDDFKVAELVIDFDRNLVLLYRSFGWPKDGQTLPLLESYAYQNVEVNVGLDASDFDTKNPNYNFP